MAPELPDMAPSCDRVGGLRDLMIVVLWEPPMTQRQPSMAPSCVRVGVFEGFRDAIIFVVL